MIETMATITVADVFPHFARIESLELYQVWCELVFLGTKVDDPYSSSPKPPLSVYLSDLETAHFWHSP